jgi:hypothetical protein
VAQEGPDVLLRALAHCDSFFAGRAQPRAYGDVAVVEDHVGLVATRAERIAAEITPELFLHRLQAAAEAALVNVAVGIHTRVTELGPDALLELDGMPPARAAPTALPHAMAGCTQAKHVPYLQREFDGIAMALLNSWKWRSKLAAAGSGDVDVLLTMLLVHSEYISDVLRETFPNGS